MHLLVQNLRYLKCTPLFLNSHLQVMQSTVCSYRQVGDVENVQGELLECMIYPYSMIPDEGFENVGQNWNYIMC